MKDEVGLDISGANAVAFEHYRTALAGLQRFVGDPVGEANAAIEARPGFVMAHVIKGYLYGLSTEAKAMQALGECIAAAAGLPMTAREAAHIEALSSLHAGRWHEAGRLLQALTRDFPTDALAL